MSFSTALLGLFLGTWAAVCLPVLGWSAWKAASKHQVGWAVLAAVVSIAAAAIGIGHLLASFGPPILPALGLIPAAVVAVAYPVTSHQRVPFKVWVVAVWLFIFVFLASFFVLSGFDTEWMKQNAWFIMGGVWFTIAISLGAITLAIVLALFGSLGRLSKNPIAYGVSGFYTSFFRGTPLIVQLFLIYLAVPQIVSGIHAPRSFIDFFTFDAIVAAILGIGMNYGAYLTEIFRAGIQSIQHGQREAAEALGMSYGQVMRKIVLPQAFRVVVPPTGNEFIAMMKDTALVSFLGATLATMELFRRAQLLGNADFRPLEAYLIAASMYWLLTAVLSFFQVRLERRMNRGHVRTTGATIVTGHGGARGGGANVYAIGGEEHA